MRLYGETLDDRALDAVFEGIIGAREGSHADAEMALEAFIELFPIYRNQIGTKLAVWRARHKEKSE